MLVVTLGCKGVLMDIPRQVADYQVSLSADHEQYWQGHGIALTHWTNCATGYGSTIREAFEDALDCLAQEGIEASKVQAGEMLAELGSNVDREIALDYCEERGEHTAPCDDCGGTGRINAESPDWEHCLPCKGASELADDDPDCAVCAGEWHYYVSIDVVASTPATQEIN